MFPRPPVSPRMAPRFPYPPLFRSVQFAYAHDINVETVSLRASMTDGGPPMRDLFDVPDLAAMDDTIVHGTYAPPPGAPQPLAMFQAARGDYSLPLLTHFTGTDPALFRTSSPLPDPQLHLPPSL